MTKFWRDFKKQWKRQKWSSGRLGFVNFALFELEAYSIDEDS